MAVAVVLAELGPLGNRVVVHQVGWESTSALDQHLGRSWSQGRALGLGGSRSSGLSIVTGLSSKMRAHSLKNNSILDGILGGPSRRASKQTYSCCTGLHS